MNEQAIEKQQRRWRDTWPEAELQRRVEALLAAKGWRFAHIRDARRQNATGLPDVIAVRGDRLLFAELKTKRGRFTPQQEAWLGALYHVGAEVKRWRPSDWPEIERVLA